MNLTGPIPSDAVLRIPEPWCILDSTEREEAVSGLRIADDTAKTVFSVLDVCLTFDGATRGVFDDAVARLPSDMTTYPLWAAYLDGFPSLTSLTWENVAKRVRRIEARTYPDANVQDLVFGLGWGITSYSVSQIISDCLQWFDDQLNTWPGRPFVQNFCEFCALRLEHTPMSDHRAVRIISVMTVTAWHSVLPYLWRLVEAPGISEYVRQSLREDIAHLDRTAPFPQEVKWDE